MTTSSVIRRLLATAPKHFTFAPCRRTLTSAPFKVDVFECDAKGNAVVVSKSRDDLARLKLETELPIRDFRIFFHRQQTESSPKPLILSRPSSNCFLLSLENIQLLCRADRCTVLGPDDSAVRSFVADLKQQLSSDDPASVGFVSSESSMHAFLHSLALGGPQTRRFELVVLETALHSVTDKFKRHLNLLKPVLELLLRETSANPSASMLRRMLAFRKSLAAFEMSVTQVRSAVSEILNVEEDLVGLLLDGDASTAGKEEVELLMEAYNSDLKEIQYELANIRNTIEDTNDFINIHLNSIRNRIIKMSLFMEMGMIAIGTGSLTAGIFGMNLAHGLEEHPTAFYGICGGILVTVGAMSGMLAKRVSWMERDTSSAHNYKALKNFFNYVEHIEGAIHAKRSDKVAGIESGEFRKLLEPVIGIQLTKDDVDSIFRALDENCDGKLDIGELAKRQRQ